MQEFLPHPQLQPVFLVLLLQQQPQPQQQEVLRVFELLQQAILLVLLVFGFVLFYSTGYAATGRQVQTRFGKTLKLQIIFLPQR